MTPVDFLLPDYGHPSATSPEMASRNNRARELVGCLLGTAVGDALGLPMEGLSKTRQHKIFHPPDRYHFLPGKGMVSDDTQHQCMAAQALIQSKGHPDLFSRDLARRLRLWILGLPAGIGFATLRALIKLWLSGSPLKSGVFSAGNGPAMRSAVLGVCYGDRPELLRSLVAVGTRITHTDPKAEYGALAVAWAAHCSARGETAPEGFCETLQAIMPVPDREFLNLIGRTSDSVRRGEPTEAFAEGLGLGRGVSGYMYHTVPVVLHAWLSHPRDFKTALLAVIRCGGDTDTTGAILGSIVGAGTGKQGIPREWLDNLSEWPQGVDWMERLATRLAEDRDSGKSSKPPAVPFVFTFLRNLFFTAVVLFHGFRRMFPPY